MEKKTFGEMELYPTTPWQLVRKSKYFQKKNPYVYFRLKDALMDRRPAKQGKSEWTGRHAWAWRTGYGRGFALSQLVSFASHVQEWLGTEFHRLPHRFSWER